MNVGRRSRKSEKEKTHLLLLYKHLLDRAHLELRRPSLVPDEEEVTVPVDDDLLLEAAALRTLLLHVGPREVAVHERGLARGQGADDAEADVGDAARQRPLLAVDERVWKRKGGMNAGLNSKFSSNRLPSGAQIIADILQ